MKDTPTAHQFVFLPHGASDSASERLFELRRGKKSIRDTTGEYGFSNARMTADGYTAECFVKRSALNQANLLPGVYYALNLSLNRDTTRSGDQWQWAASKSLGTWDRPDTWGDVLLLGSDAVVEFCLPGKVQNPLNTLVPGDPLGVRIKDPDMDLNPRKVDRISATLRVEGSPDSLFIILEETGTNTGVFHGSVGTQPGFMAPQENMLNMGGGDRVVLEYDDMRTAYGEKNQGITREMRVSWPILRLSRK